MLDLRLRTQVVPWHQDDQLSLSPSMPWLHIQMQGTLHEKTGAMLPGHTPPRGESIRGGCFLLSDCGPFSPTLLWGQQRLSVIFTICKWHDASTPYKAVVKNKCINACSALGIVPDSQ